MSEPNELAEVVGGVWTSSRVAEALGLAEAELDELRRRGELLGLPIADGDLVFPGWQFRQQADGTVQVRPEVSQLVQVLAGQPAWSVAVLFVTSAPELHELAPIDWIRANRDADVLTRFGEQVRRAWR